MTKLSSSFFNSFSAKTDEELEKEVKTDDSKVEDADADGLETVKTDDDSELNKMEYGDDDKDPNPDKTSDDDNDDEVDPFIATIDHLADKGLLYFDPEKEYEEEGEELLETVFTETLDKRYQEEYIDSIPEEYQSIFKHLKAGKPLDEWIEAVAPTNYDLIKLDDEDNQRQLIEDHLASTGMDEEDIKDAIKDYEDSGILEKKAKVALKYLKANEEKKAKQYEEELDKELQRQAEDDARSLEEFKKDVLAKEEIEGFKLDKKTRERLFDHITKPVNKRGESKLVVNQRNKDKQLLVAYFDMMDFKFDDIKKGIESKVASNLRKKLTQFTDKNATGRGGKGVEEPKQSTRLVKGVWDAPRDED